MSKNNGGPAFPSVSVSIHDFADASKLPIGMSLRDYFAGQAVIGLLANPNIGFGQQGLHEAVKGAADASYHFSDAMLIAREDKGE